MNREQKQILRMKIQAAIFWSIGIGMAVWLVTTNADTARYLSTILVVLYIFGRFALSMWDILSEWI